MSEIRQARAAEFSAAAQAVAAALLAATTDPADAIRLLLPLCQWQPTPLPGSGPLWATAQATQDAMASNVRCAACAALARASALYQPASQQDAQALRLQVTGILDAEATICADAGRDASFAGLRDLRAAVALDLAVRGANLASLVESHHARANAEPGGSLAALPGHDARAGPGRVRGSAAPLIHAAAVRSPRRMSGAPQRGAPPGAGDELSLVVGGKQWAGWQRVSLTRSMDSVPANFDIQVTEHFPLAADVAFNPGDPCQVLIGGDVVITGYVDRYVATLSPNQHGVRIAGRSKSQDLVDCSAFIGSKDKPVFQVLGGTALSIAQKLAEPYGVTIASIAGPGVEIPQFNIDFGQTVWEIIDRITRFSQLIAYDLPDGSIELAQAGQESMEFGVLPGGKHRTGAGRLFDG